MTHNGWYTIEPNQTKPNPKYSIYMYKEVYVLNNLQWLILFTNPSARAGYDTRSIFKRSLTGLNSEFSFS